MNRFRSSIRLGAALTLLLLSAPVDDAMAVPKDRPPSAQGGQGGEGDEQLEQRANEAQQRPRKKPVEPKGNPASPAAMRAGRLSCGDVITKSTTLVADIGPWPADGIIIGADNIRLNLNGHTISGTPGVGDGNAAGIRLPFRTGVTITGHPGNSGKTGTVTGFDGGVFINGGSGNTIENLVVRDNVGPGGEAALGDGIVLFHSANNRIINNLVAHNGPYDGIGVLGVDSNDNLIQGNTVEDTLASEGSFVFDGVGVIINNFLDEQGTPRRGEPIRNNHVIDNVVRRSDNSGISTIGNIDARIISNTVEDNGQRGEFCFDGGRGGIRGPGGITCQPAASPSNGIGLTAGPLAPRVTRVLIEGNTVTGNTGNGIFIRTRENRITGNTALRNGGSGRPGSGVNDFGGGRFDLYDRNFFDPLCEGPNCPPRKASCDQNVWHRNTFETAFPDCAKGTGPEPAPVPPPDPTCSDGIDNDGDGFIDEADFNCGGPPPPFEPLEPGPDQGGGLEPVPDDEEQAPIGEEPTPITPIGGDEPTPIGGDEPTPIGGDEPTPIGGDEPTPI
ncbi:MAG: right-handed parallel beta-helix repeat-containing protein, partial [Chloroflexota bacterium]|nr:right-handed parallel beta-helix repeat-containing protein [Chloroflexota bacterium]